MQTLRRLDLCLESKQGMFIDLDNGLGGGTDSYTFLQILHSFFEHLDIAWRAHLGEHVQGLLQVLARKLLVAGLITLD